MPVSDLCTYVLVGICRIGRGKESVKEGGREREREGEREGGSEGERK